jgi:hypothetical protein
MASCSSAVHVTVCSACPRRISNQQHLHRCDRPLQTGAKRKLRSDSSIDLIPNDKQKGRETLGFIPRLRLQYLLPAISHLCRHPLTSQTSKLATRCTIPRMRREYNLCPLSFLTAHLGMPKATLSMVRTFNHRKWPHCGWHRNSTLQHLCLKRSHPPYLFPPYHANLAPSDVRLPCLAS